ncbi:hypothetical protein SAMN06295974_3135 [Plantibacter flavus]|uniref:Lipoprotein n=1 Tax=Plantibacter flavus TaxID=150123 RepID=A0A3N2C408_9MICO|nr:hypothetical protein [Plantibacter flavus]ROR82242.1 hypothetical protein EDD42_2330 [Plantibacter flavus]SMG42617.1 hypothetical protein SAMN06295974_3135 [Plantibacter flavus]
MTSTQRPSRRTTARLTALAALAAIAALGLTACTTEEPRDVTLPDLVWDNGIEPTSPLESDPDVAFARTIDLAYAYAHNTGDFSFDTLVTGLPEPRIFDAYQHYLDQTPDTTTRFPGPYPWQPLSIEPNDPPTNYTGDITLTLITWCGPGDNLWLQTQTDPDHTGAFDPALARTGYMIIGHREDGTRFNAGASYATGNHLRGASEPCNGDDIPIGRFPNPTPFPNHPITQAPHPPLTLPTPTTHP